MVFDRYGIYKHVCSRYKKFCSLYAFAKINSFYTIFYKNIKVLIPYGELGYPADDGGHEKVGPKPTTFSGLRALNFVLDNPRVDRTLLFNVKLIRVDKPNGKGGFARG